MKKFFLMLLTSCMVGRGVLIMIWPGLYYLWLNTGDHYEKYVRIINGPFPFSAFGGGPFQLMMIVMCFIIGGMLIFLGYKLMRINNISF